MFRIKIIAPPAAIEKMRLRGPQILESLTQRMTLLMFKLQSKIVGEEIPKQFPNGAPNIAATVRAIPARLEGKRIVGEVEAGGPRTTKETLGGPQAGQFVDYAAVQEGGVSHSWKIQPVLYSSAWAISNKARVLSVEGLPRALAFMFNGKLIITRSVTHPGLKERPYMRQGLKDMEAQIISELTAEFNGLLQ